MLISEAFDLYEKNYMAIRQQSRRICETHALCRRQLIELIGDKDMAELTVADISEWAKQLKKTRSTNTVRNYITRLRVVADYIDLLGLPTLKAALIPIPKREATVPAFLTPQDVQAMIACSYNLRNAFVISLLYSSGIRLSELIQLNRGQIIDRHFTVIGKGNKPRLYTTMIYAHVVDNDLQEQYKKYHTF